MARRHRVILGACAGLAVALGTLVSLGGVESALVRSLTGDEPPEAARPAPPEPERPGLSVGGVAPHGMEGERAAGSDGAGGGAGWTERAEAAGVEAEGWIGTWLGRSDGEDRRIAIELTLSEDGLYVATAVVEGPDVGDEPIRVTTAGRWALEEAGVALVREETSHPGALPAGMVEIYWESALTDGVWTYADAAGLERRWERVRTVSE